MDKGMIRIESQVKINNIQIINETKGILLEDVVQINRQTIKDPKRLKASLLPLFLSIITAVLLYSNWNNLKDGSPTHLHYFSLVLWTMTFALIGSCLSFVFASFDDHTGDEYSKRSRIGFYVTYLGKYLVSALVGAIVVFGVLTAIPNIGKPLFFWLSAAMSLYYGFVADIFLLSKLGGNRI